MGLELTRRGLTALDTDDIARWETAEGRAVSQPDHPTEEWLRERRWVWRRRLHDAIRVRAAVGRPVFLCGIAVNQREMLDCFDLVLLSLDDTEQLHRLDSARSRRALLCVVPAETADFAERFPPVD